MLLLSHHSSVPMYAQIADQITTKVMAGEWLAGQPLPSIRELAAATQVSVITVKRAYFELEHAGVIVTRQGKGSFVAETLDLPRTRALEEFRSRLAALLDAARPLGLSPQQIVDEVQAALDDSDITARDTTP